MGFARAVGRASRVAARRAVGYSFGVGGEVRAGESDETETRRTRAPEAKIFSRALLLSKYVLFWLLYMR